MLIYRPFSTPDDGDLLINSYVSWVGSSSMEVTERVIQNGSPVLDAKFVMVARHASEDRAVPVNPLIAETDKQKEEFYAGELAKNERKGNYHLQQLSLELSFFKSQKLGFLMRQVKIIADVFAVTFSIFAWEHLFPVYVYM